MAEAAEEMLQFLVPEAQTKVKLVAMEFIVGFTESKEGQKFLSSRDDFLRAIINLMKDPENVICKIALITMINLSAETDIASKLLNMDNSNLVISLTEIILQPDHLYADLACRSLANLSRDEQCAKIIVDEINAHSAQPERKTSDDGCPTSLPLSFLSIIEALCKVTYNTKGNNLHYLGPLLSNLTQIQSVRGHILDSKQCVIERLLPFTEHPSLIRRGGVIGTIRNCCFETAHHSWLLSEDVNILPALLLPLAGPEELDEEDMNPLPEELHYLESDKQREVDPDIRIMLVETIHQLCATQKCRKLIKDKNTYIIMREFHKWEKDPRCDAAILKLIELLIADEPSEGMEDLEKIEIPEKVRLGLEEAMAAEEKEIREEEVKLRSGQTGS